MERQVRFLYEHVRELLKSPQFEDLHLITSNEGLGAECSLKLDLVEKSIKQSYENMKKSKENNE